MVQDRPNADQNFNNIENEEEFLKAVIEKRVKSRRDKAKLWRDLFLKHKDFILKSLQEGVSKADIHYALNEIVKRKFGKQYMIKANYFYMLLNDFLKEVEGNKTSNREKAFSKKTSPDISLDEYNEGGIL